VLLTALDAVLLRTVRDSMPQPASAATQPATGHLRAAAQTRQAAKSVTHAREAVDLPGAAPAKPAKPGVPAESLAAFEPDCGGCTVGQTKANGRQGAGEEQHVSHLRHATLQLSLSSSHPRSIRTEMRHICVTYRECALGCCVEPTTLAI
jgi:hypothetical protein